ncbi:MAG: SDR family NAD(P)-dependent oxidoreductase [Actinophytocola sp.]|uniref:SDR family oxidoreductase n=1 Tax=Actinophytocola sp. TaxID=1872138 RepID=UPI001329C235|nr:SDR family oxidoreductase [Actinophytocola sp.]MPZ81747.1 SDR family NAD(P)-dependent oxidoreductase [Actinophytocola sp.]
MSTPKIALVTGGGSGLGRVIATALTGAGYRVVVAGRTRASLESVSGADPVVADVTDPDAVRALFDHVADRYGRLDLLVNNAGVSGPVGPADELSEADWQAVVDTNLTGSFRCAQAAFRLMKAQDPRGGRIINNGSVSAHVPRPNAVAYTATKHAIAGLTKALSLEGRAHDIAVSQLDIGNAASDMTAGFGSGTLQADGSRRPEPTMDATHVGDMVVHMAGLPLSANVAFVTLMATTMPFIGRG